MKSKTFILAGLVLFAALNLFQPGAGVEAVQGRAASASVYSLPLNTGWNLVSFNLHPTSTLIADVLNSAAGQYGLVYAYDPALSNPWLKYDPAMPASLNSLKNLDEKMGFWIKMNAAQTLAVSGSAPGTSSIAVRSGWNLVGYPSTLDEELPGALSWYGLANFSLAFAYHASDTADPWKKFDPLMPGSLNDLKRLAPGWGYWVKSGAASTWQVEYSATPSLSRFGGVLALRPITDYVPYDLDSMRLGWYVDYYVTANAPRPYGMEYIPIVRVKQVKLAEDGSGDTACRYGPYYASPARYTVIPSLGQIQSVAMSKPGMTWVIGNEIERIDWQDGSTCGGQDEILPELYAQAYHDIVTAIKAADPTAKVANGSLVEFTDLRRQYLDRVWAEYTRLANLNGWPDKTMPVDVWNMHFFVLQEIKGSWGAEIPAGLSASSGEQYTFPDDNWDFTKLWVQVVRMRTWMKDHGQKDKPLITTEYGVNYPYSYYSCFDSADQTACPRELRDRMMLPSLEAFLNQTDASLGDSNDGNRLVQRWAWWSLDGDAGVCDGGVYLEDFGGALFHSGLGPPGSAGGCAFPAQGISTLGTYWKQYVQSLP